MIFLKFLQYEEFLAYVLVKAGSFIRRRKAIFLILAGQAKKWRHYSTGLFG
jgi:hypothetical protein